MAIVEHTELRPLRGPLGRRCRFLGAPFDLVPRDRILDLIRSADPTSRFRYVVTPNVDHVVRLNRERALGSFYDQAWLSLCDSRPIQAMAHATFLKLPLMTGSDLTVHLFKSVIEPGDLISVIAANEAIMVDLAAAYPNVRFRSLVPPPDVWTDTAALDACVDFVAAGDARFVFIAIGSPQSEKIAHALASRSEAMGIGFCVGAALEFLVGRKRRAPLWMQRAGLEWLHRMASDPKRLWRRYVYAVVPLAGLFWGEVSGRLPTRN
ncbi:glycosyl transferase [Rhizobium sp. Leaf371]|uniref:WecB/TagA/CpsF family glycosyltransferase n=1 Tax=Rhizobium sp. Leaf371 TaxID=1736355 RepID=UPI00071339B9|nr:WecB/TagA/CpsF family glycosyltransferase [Rhizobium sp. Leaf371]KQS61261.1 glycosyl transferase [Rhizobium sp. Leaf371]